MAKKLHYSVDYHVIVASYFGGNDLVSGDSIATIWSRLGALGGLHTTTSICRKDLRRFEDIIQDSTELGSPRIKERILRQGDTFSSFSSSAVRPDAGNAVLDSDVNFSYTPEEVWRGERTVGRLDLSVSGQVIERVTEKVVLEVIHDLFRISDQCHSHYGLVDIAKPDDAYAGGVFGCIWPGTASLHRTINQNNWSVSGALKGDRARGLYWGNYFGRAILARLGGRERFLQDYCREARNYDGTPDVHVWEYGDGVFVSLCKSMADMKPGAALHPAADNNVRWLCRDLGVRGVLNPW